MPRRFYRTTPDLSILAIGALLVLLAIALTIDAIDRAIARAADKIRNWGK